MIRIIAIAALSLLLCIVLYLPSRTTPEQMLAVLHQEHQTVTEVWGADVAARVLRRMLDLQESSATVSTPPAAPSLPASASPIDAAVANQVGQMNTRLFANPYFRSIDALFALVTYRLCAVLELLPLVALFFTAAFIDGAVVRQVRSKELIAHSAERFTASLALGILVAAGVVITWVLPFPLHPMAELAALVAMLFAISRALANYHLMR